MISVTSSSSPFLSFSLSLYLAAHSRARSLSLAHSLALSLSLFSSLSPLFFLMNLIEREQGAMAVHTLTETHTTLNVFYPCPLAGEVEMQQDICESIRELVDDNGYEAGQNTNEQNTKEEVGVRGNKHKTPSKMPIEDIGGEKLRQRVPGGKDKGADLRERTEWSCKNSCGFHAAFEQVYAHEKTCDLTASASQKPMPHPGPFSGTAVDGVTLGDEERGGVSRSGEKVEEDRESGMVTGVGESTCDSMDSGVSREINEISDALAQIRSQVIFCVSLSRARSLSLSLALSLSGCNRERPGDLQDSRQRSHAFEGSGFSERGRQVRSTAHGAGARCARRIVVAASSFVVVDW